MQFNLLIIIIQAKNLSLKSKKRLVYVIASSIGMATILF